MIENTSEMIKQIIRKWTTSTMNSPGEHSKRHIGENDVNRRIVGRIAEMKFSKIRVNAFPIR